MNHLFVFDTNMLISASLKPNSTARNALEKASAIGDIVFSISTHHEYTDVFMRPRFDKYLSLVERLSIIDQITLSSYFVEPTISIQASRDEKDNQFLELAVAANANCIVTGDKDLLVLSPFRGIPIVTAASFIEMPFLL